MAALPHVLSLPAPLSPRLEDTRPIRPHLSSCGEEVHARLTAQQKYDIHRILREARYGVGECVLLDQSGRNGEITTVVVDLKPGRVTANAEERS